MTVQAENTGIDVYNHSNGNTMESLTPQGTENNTFLIEENFGRISNGNLFHTFEKFNLSSGQVADFQQTTASIQNVISRVIGGNVSNIDGTIKTTIPNFYLINPAGIIFGANASLDVAGSFHASTADYIRGENVSFGTEKFDGTDGISHLFTDSNFFVDHPAAFGFIDKEIYGNIEIKGLGEYDPNIEAPGLTVNPEQTISLIGGDIDFKQGSYYYDNNDIFNSGSLYANAGRINLASVKSAHEVPLQHIYKVDSIDNRDKLSAHKGDLAIVSNSEKTETYQFDENNQWILNNNLKTIPGVKIGEIDDQAEMGDIYTFDRTTLSVDQFAKASDYDYNYQSQSGEIIIRGGQIVLDKTKVLAQNSSDEKGGNIEIYGNSIKLSNDTLLTTEVAQNEASDGNLNGKGSGGDIILAGNNGTDADSVRLFRSMIATGTKSLEKDASSGCIDIKSRNISLFSTYQITDKVFQTYETDDALPEEIREKLSVIKNVDFSSESAFYETLLGKEGILTVDEYNTYQSIIMNGVQEGSAIYSEVKGYGKGGLINLDVQEALTILGKSKIYSNATNVDDNAGDAGNIIIKARTIFLTELDSEITSQTLGPGEGGSISLYADESITINEFASIRSETGKSGGSESSTSDSGNAGNILLESSRVSILKGGRIESSTYVNVSDQENKGKAGDITIRADNLIHLSGADVVDADASSIRNRSQNTATNAGGGGKVSLSAREIKFEDGAFIGSETYGGGNGGDVELIASDKIHFSGTDSAGYACKIYTNSLFTNRGQTGEPINTAGKSGNITLQATNLIRLEDGAGVTASTMGPGEGGSVEVKATKTLEINGGNPHGENEDGFASGLFARAEGQGLMAGSAQKINVSEVDEVILFNGGVISTSTLGAGDAGEIKLSLGKKLTISGQAELVSEDKYLQSQNNYSRMYTIKGDYRSGIYSSSENEESYAGNAGAIIIATPSLELDYNATISTSTKGAGKAGNIDLQDVGDISLMNGATVASATFSESNTQYFELSESNFNKLQGSTKDIVRIQDEDNNSIIIHNGDIVQLDGNLYYYKAGEGCILLNAYEQMVKYSFRIFKIDDANTLNEMIPEKGDIAKLEENDTVKYYYFDQGQWNEYNENQDLTPEYIPVFVNNIFDNSSTYKKGDISQLVFFNYTSNDSNNENENTSFAFNGSNWVLLPDAFDFANNSSKYFELSTIRASDKNLFSFMEDTTRLVETYFNNGEKWTNYRYDGDAGNISILLNDQLNLTHDITSISTSTYGRGKAGLIDISSLNIQLSDKSQISSASLSSGNGGDAGQIKIGSADRKLELLDISTIAQINTSTEGLGDAGNIEIYTDQISMKSEGTIASSSNALGRSGDAGNIIIHSESLSLIHENTSVNTSTYGQGKAGNIDLLVNNLDLDQKASISSASNSIGKGGDAGVIRIGLAYEDNINPLTKADKPWHITDPSNRVRVTNESSISTASAGAGKAGIVLLGANNIDVNHSGSISSANSSVADIIYFKDSIDQIKNLTDNIGSVVEVADDGTGNPNTYIFTGKGNNYGWEEKKSLSLNRVATISEMSALNVSPGDIAKVADAGDGYSKNFIFDGSDWQAIESDKTVQVHIRNSTDELSANIEDEISAEKGDILYTTSNSGVYLCEDNTWKPIQWSSVLEASDQESRQTAKDFQVSTIEERDDIPDTLINDGDRVNINDTDYYVRINNSWEPVSKSGNAGNINIIAENEVSLNTNGSLNTEAISSGGGKISIEGKDTLYLFQGLITASVQKGFGAGGDINTRSNSVIMNHSGIEANAVEGDGGAIFIKTEQYVKSHDSYVTATSERGNDGTVKIDAPKVDISKGLVVLPTNFLDATRWVKTPCALRSGESISRLVLEGRDAIPTSLIDWQPSPPLDITDVKKDDKKKKSSKRNRPTLLESKNIKAITKDLTLN